MAMRKGEAPNPAGDFRCDEAGCETRFFTRLDFLLHKRRGRHGQLSFLDSFRRVRGDYSGTRPKEREYARQSKVLPQ